MSASNEIRYKIGGDTSALQRSFSDAEKIAKASGERMAKENKKAVSASSIAAQTAAAVAGKWLHKEVGLVHGVKSIVLALGIGIPEIADRVSRFFSGMSEDAEEAYRRIVAAGERATQALARQITSRQTSAQQLAGLSRQERGESRAGGLKEQTYTQRVLSQLPVVGGFFKNAQEHAGIVSSEERMAAMAEDQAAAQERAVAAEELKLKIADSGRAKRTAADAQDLARRRADGKANVHEQAQYVALVNQELDLRREANATGTSAARKDQLLIQAEALVTKQLEMAARWRETGRATAEKIQQIERETAATGETKGEQILRLKREALDLDKKSKDLTRSEDDRRALKVQSAEKVAAAAKAEYDWRIKTANISDSLKTPSGRANTTEQGVRARKASNYRGLANRARAEGRFGAAAHYGELANQSEEQFGVADRIGMKTALGMTTPIANRLNARGPNNSAANAPDPLKIQLEKANTTLTEIKVALQPKNLE